MLRKYNRKINVAFLLNKPQSVTIIDDYDLEERLYIFEEERHASIKRSAVGLLDSQKQSYLRFVKRK